MRDFKMLEALVKASNRKDGLVVSDEETISKLRKMGCVSKQGDPTINETGFMALAVSIEGYRRPPWHK